MIIVSITFDSGIVNCIKRKILAHIFFEKYGDDFIKSDLAR